MMSASISRFGRWRQGREEMLNHKLQAELRSALAREANATVAPIEQTVAERLWDRISDSLAASASAETKRIRASQRRWGGGAALLVGAAAAIGLMLAPQSIRQQVRPGQILPGVMGVKGFDAAPVVALNNLRFAVVNPDGSLTPGHDEMRVPVNATLVFSVEARGVEKVDGFPVTLSYQILPDRHQEVIIDYVLKENQEIFTGPNGYIAFKPNRAGTYRFALASHTSLNAEGTSAGQKSGAAQQGAKDVASFSIRVVDR